MDSQLQKLISHIGDALLLMGDPLRELDVKERGSVAHRVEGYLLAALYERSNYSWNAVAIRLRGRPVGSTIQRAIERHPELANLAGAKRGEDN